MGLLSKFSTLSIKMSRAGILLGLILLSGHQAYGQTENEKFVLQSVRLSLWYEGMSSEMKISQESFAEDFYPEELGRALEIHEEQKRLRFALK
jgi:protein subunit release factor B